MSRKEIRERAWQQMELLLDQEMPQKKRRRIGFYIPYAAAITLFGVITTFLFQQQGQNQQFADADDSPIIIETIGKNLGNPFFTVNKEKAIQKAAEKRTNNSLNTLTAKVDNTFNEKKTVVETNLSANLNENATTKVFIVTKATRSSSTTPVKEIASKQELSNQQEHQERELVNHSISPNETIVIEVSKDDINGFETEDLITNQQQREVLFMTPDIKKSFQPGRDMGLSSNGTIGFVSENMEDYGLRMGLGLEKPISKNLSANAAVRYSIYKDTYSETYQTDTPEELRDQSVISRMHDRSVSRNFIEMPLYGTYHLSENLSIKTGVIATYNKNNSESPGFSTQTIINSSSISEETKNEIGKLYGDKSGYLGEYLIGASLELERISFDVEATRGFINNQNIDNRNVVGMRIGYKFRK